MNCNGKRIYANKGKGQPDQDPQWYVSKSEAAKEAAQLGFTNATGDAVKYAGSTLTSIPGIMTIYYAPMIGHWINVATDVRWAQNPYNMTFRRVYAQMRRKNTASPVYTANDLGVYMWCVGSLYNYHAYIARALKIVRKFKNRNKYYAKAIVSAMGLDYDDIVKNQADLRIWLNTFAKRINNVLSVPKLPLYERQYWINSHIWKDGNTDKSQLYIPIICQYHKYNATKTSDGGGTDVVALFNDSTAYDTVSVIMANGESMLEQLITDDDILLISADVDKWYGGNQFSLPDINEGDEYEPEYSLEVLTQIQNTNIITMDSNNGLTQNATGNYLNNILVLTGFDFKQLNEYQDNCFITMPNDKPSPEEIVVATRTLSGVVSHSTNTITELSCGSEICVGIDVLYYAGGNLTSLVQDDGYTIGQGALDNGVLAANDVAQILGYLHMFDMMPKFYLIEDADAGNYGYATLTEIENSTPVDISRLDQIHYMALLNEFGFYDETKSSSNF